MRVSFCFVAVVVECLSVRLDRIVCATCLVYAVISRRSSCLVWRRCFPRPPPSCYILCALLRRREQKGRYLGFGRAMRKAKRLFSYRSCFYMLPFSIVCVMYVLRMLFSLLSERKDTNPFPPRYGLVEGWRNCLFHCLLRRERLERVQVAGRQTPSRLQQQQQQQQQQHKT